MKTILITFCLLFSGLSQAALIQLQPNQTEYQVGDTVELSMTISGLTETVASFKTEVFYQPSAFLLQSWQFGSGLDDGFGSLQFADHDEAMGSIALDEFTFASDESILAGQQGNGFVLANLSFVALQAGDFWLNFNPNWFGVESFDGAFIDASFADVNLSISNPAQVPAPATMMLLLLGLGLLLRRR